MTTKGRVASSIVGDLIICFFLGDIMNGYGSVPWSLRQLVAKGAPRRSLLRVAENQLLNSQNICFVGSILIDSRRLSTGISGAHPSPLTLKLQGKLS